MTILDMIEIYRRATGRDPFTARWEAALRFFYGLELRDVDVQNLVASTNRTEAAIRALPRRARRELWSRVGRRGRKSFTAALIAIFEAAFGGHEKYLVKGERGLIAVISKDTAGSTIVAKFCEIHAEALGIATKWTSIGSVRVLELEGFAFGIACFPCNGKAPRGYAIPVVIADEIAHWQTNDDEYVNSDEAVLKAVNPAMAQFPDSKLIAISSPLGRDGLHYNTIEKNLGDNADDGILAVEGPTWEWDPSITEERCRELARTEEEFNCEFGAIPDATEGTAFNGDDLERAYKLLMSSGLEGLNFSQPSLYIDPATSGNTFACFAAAWGRANSQQQWMKNPVPEGRGFSADTFMGYALDVYGQKIPIPKPKGEILVVYDVFGWTGAELRELGMDEVCARLGRYCGERRIGLIFTDRHGDGWIQPAVKRVNSSVQVVSCKPSNEQIHEAITLGRIWMRDGKFAVTHKNETMKNDLLRYPRRIVGGGFKYGAPGRGGHHHDYADAFKTLLVAHVKQDLPMDPGEVNFRIPGSPLVTPNTRTELR